MRRFLRRLRAAIGNAVTWAVAWAIGGFTIGVLAHFAIPALGISLWVMAPAMAVRMGTWGFIGGLAYSAVLGLVYRGRSVRELRSPGTWLWGALAGLAVPLAVVAFGIATGVIPFSPLFLASTTLIFGGLGLATSLTTIEIAQRGGERLESGDSRQWLTGGT